MLSDVHLSSNPHTSFKGLRDEDQVLHCFAVSRGACRQARGTNCAHCSRWESSAGRFRNPAALTHPDHVSTLASKKRSRPSNEETTKTSPAVTRGNESIFGGSEKQGALVRTEAPQSGQGGLLSRPGLGAFCDSVPQESSQPQLCCLT